MTASFIRPYQGRDILNMTPRGDFMLANNAVDSERAFTLARGRWHVAGVGGWVFDRPGCATLWGRCVADVTVREWVLIRDRVREIAGDLLADGAHRVQAFCYALPDERHLSFLQAVGLTDEVHRLRAFGPDGADFWLCAMVRQG